MREQATDGESPIYDAVKGLSESEITQRVQRTASEMNLSVGDDHLRVILALVEHYQTECQQHDCRAASPHMRFLTERFSDRGGSRYLYMLFDQGNASGDDAPGQMGVLTLIHRLAGLPELTHNEDEGFGTLL